MNLVLLFSSDQNSKSYNFHSYKSELIISWKNTYNLNMLIIILTFYKTYTRLILFTI